MPGLEESGTTVEEMLARNVSFAASRADFEFLKVKFSSEHDGAYEGLNVIFKERMLADRLWSIPEHETGSDDGSWLYDNLSV